MEIAVLADIHSNYVALETCMAYALGRGIKSFLFLGDYIGEFAYPERTMALLREYAAKYDCMFIRGNKEEYWLEYRREGERGWEEYSSTTGALYYAYRHLTQEDLCFFEELPYAAKLQYAEAPTLIACHGSLTGVRGNMLPGNDETKKALESTDVDYILYGHTHIQGKTVHKGKVAINPGAVGVPLRAQGKTQFAILHGEREGWSEELVSLEYDRERVVRELAEAGLTQRAPYWCKITELLMHNRLPEEVAHMRILQKAMLLCEKENGVCVWPDIPEHCWEAALKEYGIC